MQIPIHPLAAILPEITGKEFDDLVASIKANGQRDPITVYDGQILDGRNRFRACEAAGVEPIFETFKGADIQAFVIDKNFHRRHLTISQRALYGATMDRLSIGVRSCDRPSENLKTTKEIAEIVDVGEGTITRARRALDEGTEEEIDAIKSGKLTVNQVVDEIKKRAPDGKKARSNLNTGGMADRKRRLQVDADTWRIFKEVIEALSGLPLPADLARIVHASRKRTETISNRLPTALKWLNDFSTEWENINNA